MSDFYDEFVNELETLKVLNNFEIELGVLKEDQYVTVAVLHGGGNNTEYLIPVEDVIYFAEYGTVSFPGTHLLQTLIYNIEQQLNIRIEKIINRVFNNGWTADDIYREMHELEIYLNTYIYGYLSGQVKEMTFLADKTRQAGLIDFPVDISILKKYIHCKIYKKI